ncbi:MAG TPA: ice-binding family protein [Stellaceae bacterium]|nr:ice-binding family protein [Stellaceae bacterium]
MSVSSGALISTAPFTRSIVVAAAMAGTMLAGSPSAAAARQVPVQLGTAGNYAVLSKTGVTNTGTSSVLGNIGASPIASTAITGFGLTLSSSGQFSTSPLVTGDVYAADYAAPTPSNLTTAIGDMQTAYTDAAGRTNPTATNLGAGNIGGLTIAPGLYKWGTSVNIPTDVTLSGGPNAVWIFQIAGTLDIAAGKSVILAGGAQAKNIFWQVAGQTTLETTSVLNGIVLDQVAVVAQTGATLNGRALAQTAVTLDATVVDAKAAAGPAIYQGRALVTAASSGCYESVGNSFAATIKMPVATPEHFKIALLSDQVALHLARITTTETVDQIKDDGSLIFKTLQLHSGSSFTTLGNGAAEASATFAGTNCTMTLFFALSTPPA